MKKLIGALLAAAAIGTVSSPALASDGHNDNANYSQYFGGYRNFDALYQHDLQGIQHGVSDGSYTRREARYFMSQLRNIRQRESYFRSRDGELSPEEGRDIQVRLERLHEVMHEAHEDGHDMQDDWNNAGQGYSGGSNRDNGYGGSYPRR